MLARLRRITRDGRWIPEIDSLRFIAIMSVVLFHMHRELILRSGRIVPVQSRYAGMANLLSHGDRGVPLFFIISGFILCLPFARRWLQRGKRVSLGKYFLRRLTRLEPPYIASYAVAILLFGIFTHGSGITRSYLEHVGAGIVYLNGLIFHDLNPVNSVTWSLEIEIQFYLVAPIFALLFMIRNAVLRRSMMAGLIAAVGIAQIAWMPESGLLVFTLLNYAQYFLAGLLLGDFYLVGLPRTSAWWDAIAIPGWYAYFAVSSHDWTRVAFPFLLLLLCAAALRSRLLRWFFSNQTIAIVGGMCYSIYLLHFLLIAAFFKVTRYLIVPQDYLTTYLIQVVVTVLPVLVLCAVYYRWVERVCMDPEWPAKLAQWMRRGHVRQDAVVEEQETR